MKNLISLFFLLGFFINVQSQDISPKQKANSIGLDFSYLRSHLEDRHFSPFNNVGNGAGITLSYGHQKSDDDNFFGLELSGAFAGMKAKALDYLQSELYVISFNSKYLWKVYSKAKWNVHTGVQLRADLFVPLFQNGNAFALSIFSEYAADFDARVSFRLNEKTIIQSELSIPVISFIGRPPYGTFNEEISEDPILYALTKMEFAHLGKYQGLKFTTGITRDLSSRWSTRFRYQWHLKRLNNEYPALYSIQFVHLGIQFKF